MKIGINCGHTLSGTIGGGAVGYLNESNETRAVGNKLIALLKAGGHTVVNCTNDKAGSVNANLQAICNLANAQSLDLFVSIHFNAGGGQGTEVYTYGGERYKEAVNVCNGLNALGFKNRGVKDGSGLYVIKHTKAKAMLIEVCFVDTQSDANLYKKLGANVIANAIYKAITGTAAKEEKQMKDIKGHYAEQAIQDIIKMGIMNGYSDGTFKPDQPITRAQVAVVARNVVRYITGK